MKHAAALGALVLAALVFLGAASPSAPRILLRAQAWTEQGPALAHTLTHAPRECASRRDAQTEIGRTLFRSPALIGGPAARVGLSCNACHASGRVTAAFLLPELTDRAGHADVTSQWASKVRGDAIANPIAIPDLGGAGARASFGQAHDPSLEHFVRGVIVGEFQGDEPPPEAFTALIAYIRALDACAIEDAPMTLADAAGDVRRALAAALQTDASTASLLVLAAQDDVGRVAERLPARRFARERRELEALSRELGAARAAGGYLDAELAAMAPGWSARFDALASSLARRERRSYFNQATLARDLAKN